MKAHEEDEETGKGLNEREKMEKRNAYRKLGAIGKLHNIVVHCCDIRARMVIPWFQHPPSSGRWFRTLSQNVYIIPLSLIHS